MLQRRCPQQLLTTRLMDALEVFLYSQSMQFSLQKLHGLVFREGVGITYDGAKGRGSTAVRGRRSATLFARIPAKVRRPRRSCKTTRRRRVGWLTVAVTGVHVVAFVDSIAAPFILLAPTTKPGNVATEPAIITYRSISRMLCTGWSVHGVVRSWSWRERGYITRQRMGTNRCQWKGWSCSNFRVRWRSQSSSMSLSCRIGH